MRTISIANLKAHLSAELKKVQQGNPVTVLDHKHPVAVLGPLLLEGVSRAPSSGVNLVKSAKGALPTVDTWGPLIRNSSLPGLLEDRQDR